MIPGRRFAAYGGMRRPSFRGAGGRVAGPLLALEDGTFSRSSSAWALGSDALLDAYASNALRTEYRSDLGLYLLEGERTNHATQSEDFSHADWTIGTSSLQATVEAEAIASPDGNVTADRVEDAGGSNFEQLQQVLTLPDVTATFTLSVYAREGTSGVAYVRLRTEGGGGTSQTSVFDFTTETFTTGSGQFEKLANGWYRLSIEASRTAGNNTTGIINLAPTDGTAANTGDVYFWGAQLEEGDFPSSYIHTTTAAATRAADSLTFASGDIPERVLSGKFTQQFRPYAATSDLVSGDEQWLLSVGGANNGLRIRHDGTNVLLEYLRGGVVITASAALTYDRHQAMSYTLDHGTGGLAVSGATSGDGTTTGTSGSWTAATMRVGGVQAGSNEAFAGLGNMEKAA